LPSVRELSVLTGRGPHAHQAGHQEGEAALLPVSHQLELWNAAADLGGSSASRHRLGRCEGKFENGGGGYAICNVGSTGLGPEGKFEFLQGRRGNACICVQGDNDPVDVVEIGSRQLRCGAVYRVKVLGAYAMIGKCLAALTTSHSTLRACIVAARPGQKTKLVIFGFSTVK
jgi:Inorganic pyrophosphatase